MVGARAYVHSDVSPATNQCRLAEPLVLGGGTIDQSASWIDLKMVRNEIIHAGLADTTYYLKKLLKLFLRIICIPTWM